MTETWKTIEGYGGRYEVSSLGRIKRVKSIGRDNAKLKILKQGTDKDGYMKICLPKNLKEARHSVHRIVLQTFVGNPPRGKTVVNHKNGIKNDNRVENLEWCSNQENIDHANRTGLFEGIKGARHYKAKLTKKDVLRIRKEYLKGETTLKHLGKKYGVSFSTIGRIINKSSWKSI